MATASVTDASVLVVGFGPVGATLAGLLAGQGVDVIAVDREVDVFPLPRAAHLDHEIVRIMQELGCADEMLADMRPNAGMDFLTADHRVLLSMRSPGVTHLGHPASMFFHQPTFEAQLRSAVRARGADVRLGTGVAALDDRADHVAVTLDDATVLTARYVVACDGARSATRRALGTTVDDLGFEEPWLVVDLRLDGPQETLPVVALQVCDPARPHTLVPMPGDRFRFEFMLLPGEDPEAMQDAGVVESLVSPWLGAGSFVVERSAVYTFHGLIAREWRRGRVFLAGDAAHQMPPFLGQGMCSEMRDAANLAWKLCAVLRGGAPTSLLDTYQAEREAHVRAIVEAAVGFGRIICTLDPEVAAGRDAAMLAARGDGEGPANGGAPMPPLSGPLVGTLGGVPAAQPAVGGTRLDDVTGPRWLVLARRADDLDGTAAWWRALGAVVWGCDEHPDAAALLDRLGADVSVAVVRPDRYVLGASTVALAELTALARPLLGE